MSSLPTDEVTFDLAGGNRWGRAVYRVGDAGPEPGKPFEITGCLTPLPVVGNTMRVSDGSRWKFTRVNAWGNPRDGFDATLERINV